MKDNQILVRKVYDLINIEEAEIFKNTGVGIVEERGMEIRDVAIRDKVVWVGIPTGDRVIVPEYLFAKIPDDLEDKIGVFGGIGAFVIQAIRESSLTFGEKVVVLGHGVLKELTSQVIALFGIQSLGLDFACKGDVEIDGVFVCPEREVDINLIANSLRNKVAITVLTEGHIDLPPELLQEKKLKLIFPGHPQLKKRDVYSPKAYIRWTIKEDLRLFLKLLKEEKVIIDGGYYENMHCKAP